MTADPPVGELYCIPNRCALAVSLQQTELTLISSLISSDFLQRTPPRPQRPVEHHGELPPPRQTFPRPGPPTMAERPTASHSAGKPAGDVSAEADFLKPETGTPSSYRQARSPAGSNVKGRHDVLATLFFGSFCRSRPPMAWARRRRTQHSLLPFYSCRSSARPYRCRIGRRCSCLRRPTTFPSLTRPCRTAAYSSWTVLP